MKSKLAPFLALLLVFALAVPVFAAPERESRSDELIDVLVGFKERSQREERRLVIENNGGELTREFRIVPAVSARLTQRQIDALSRDPRISVIEPDGEVFALDAELDNTWGVKRIGAGEVHGVQTGNGVNVAVVDSGVDYTHPDIAANYAGGYDFVNNDSDPMDDNGHGTHVAGTIAALDNDSGVVGASPSAKIYALKVLSASGSGSWSNIIAAIDWAAANGIQITNNSYGGSSDPGTIVKAAFDNAYNAGVLHVAAAGNSGNCKGSGSNVGYPAKYSSVVAVSATDKNDSRPCFSSTGTEVEVAAPGVTINSTKLGGGYVEFNGTSMASPHVAGVAALVVGAGAGDTNGNGRVNDDVRAILTGTATDLGANGKDNLYGFGLVNALAAVNAVSPVTPPEPEPEPDPEPPASNEIFVQSVNYFTSGSQNRNLNVAVKVVDDGGLSISGATVSITLTNTTRNRSWDGQASTGSNGTVTFTLRNAPSGCYKTVVKSITISGKTWDGLNPDEGFCK